MNPKTVLITGASRGIGKAIAKEFASKNYHLFLTCLKETEKLTKLQAELENCYGVSCHVFQTDMSDSAQVDRLFAQIETHCPRLDVLVNNAGISYTGLLTHMTPEQWNRVIATNLSSLFYTCRRAIPVMLRHHQGKILNISSVWGCVGASCEVAYSASKGGVNAFTMALAKELAPSNIQVNAIACGAVETDMNQFLSGDEKAALLEEIPAGRFALPEEAARLALSLCESPEYLTGQILKLDGGWI